MALAADRGTAQDPDMSLSAKPTAADGGPLMFKRIIVPVDRTMASLRALRPARVLADAIDAEVVAATVVAKPADRDAAETVLLERTTANGVEVDGCIVVVNGFTISQGLESLAQDRQVLLTIATDGHSRTRSLTGSVAEEMVHALAGQPSLLVGPSVAADADLHGPIVVCVDPEVPPSAQLIGSARRFARRLAMAPLALSILPESDTTPPGRWSRRVHDGDGPALTDQLAVLENQGFETIIRHGVEPAESIVEFADRVGASFLAVGTRPRVGLSRLVFGSVAIETISRAHCPVLTVSV